MELGSTWLYFRNSDLDIVETIDGKRGTEVQRRIGIAKDVL